MSDPKTLNFNDRRTASAAAKQAMLAKFKPKPAVTDPLIDLRRAEKAAELERLRAERAAERETKRAAGAEAAAKKAEEDAITEEARHLALRAAQKAARDARYAARKQKRK
ncbi:DUF6481 family protein [Phenylobacterium sp.]|jgi:hypothetical protein|uniref:DUF6481 family protein n=1 Tax=Phenylobacterium sp. TaxID=1871053 RepID=UPI002F412022